MARNEIEDGGMRALESAIAGGAFPALKDIYVDGNPAGYEARKAVKDDLPQEAVEEVKRRSPVWTRVRYV